MRALEYIKRFRMACFALIALCAAWQWLGAAAFYNEFRDAQVLFHYENVAVRTVREFLEMPLWDPYYCGGMYLLGSPQSRYASPLFLFSLAFGAQRAQPLIAWVLLIVGMEGFYQYFQTYSRHALGPILIAPIAALSGLFAQAYFMGWINFFGFEIVPWVLFGVVKTIEQKKIGFWAIALGFACIIGFGGTYAAPMAALFALLESVIRLCVHQPRGSKRAALSSLAVAVFFAITISAFRLIPIAETLLASPRLMLGTPEHSWQDIAHALFYFSHPVDGDVSFGGSFFLSPVILGLAVFANFQHFSVSGTIFVLRMHVHLCPSKLRRERSFGASADESVS